MKFQRQFKLVLRLKDILCGHCKICLVGPMAIQKGMGYFMWISKHKNGTRKRVYVGIGRLV